MEEASHVGSEGVYGKSLYLLNFAVNLKNGLKIVLIKGGREWRGRKLSLIGLRTNLFTVSQTIHSKIICHLTMEICSQKCVVRQFHHCVNIIEFTYTNLDGIGCYTPMLYSIAYYS